MVHGRFFYRWSNDLIMSYNVHQPTKWFIESKIGAFGIIFGVIDKVIRFEERLSDMLALFIIGVIRIALHKALNLILYCQLSMPWFAKIFLKYSFLASAFLTNNAHKSKRASVCAPKQTDLRWMPYGINQIGAPFFAWTYWLPSHIGDFSRLSSTSSNFT